jgi:CpeT protein
MSTTGPLHVGLFRAAFLVSGLACAWLSGCQTAAGERREQQAALTGLMVGSFSSAAQAAKAPEDYRDIHLSMTPIWPERSSDREAWLYVEQAVSAARSKPYRQRIYRVMPLAAGQEIEVPIPGSVPARTAMATLVSEVYKIPGQEAYVNADGDPTRFVALTPEMLEKLEGCSVYLAKVDANMFAGGTVGSGCISSAFRGADYVTSEVLVTKDGLRTWDRGFDKLGKHVWGAEKGPYEFMRE